MQPVVLITGAASGLGWAMTQQYLALGSFVYLLDIQSSLLEQRMQQLAEQGHVKSARSLIVDVTDSAALNGVIKTVSASHSGIDALINNAGITHRSLIEETQTQVFQQVMAVDFHGPVALTLACLPLLKAAKGTVINISSMAGWMPVMGRGGYCAAKSAMHQFFEVLRCEIQKDDVHVLMVYPSFVDTPIEQAALSGNGQRAGHARSTIGRIASADEIAQKIVAAHQKKQARLFPDRFTYFASILYKLWPSLHLKLMSKKFDQEFNPQHR